MIWKKRKLSAEVNWIKRLQTPYPLGLNDQIYQQGNISAIRSNMNIFSLKPDIHIKRRSHGCIAMVYPGDNRDWIGHWMTFCEMPKK